MLLLLLNSFSWKFFAIILFGGILINAIRDNKNLRKYGSLRSYFFLPLTFTAILIASLKLVVLFFMASFFYYDDSVLEYITKVDWRSLFNFYSSAIVEYIKTVNIIPIFLLILFFFYPIFSFLTYKKLYFFISRFSCLKKKSTEIDFFVYSYYEKYLLFSIITVTTRFLYCIFFHSNKIIGIDCTDLLFILIPLFIFYCLINYSKIWEKFQDIMKKYKQDPVLYISSKLTLCLCMKYVFILNSLIYSWYFDLIPFISIWNVFDFFVLIFISVKTGVLNFSPFTVCLAQPITDEDNSLFEGLPVYIDNTLIYDPNPPIYDQNPPIHDVDNNYAFMTNLFNDTMDPLNSNYHIMQASDINSTGMQNLPSYPEIPVEQNPDINSIPLQWPNYSYNSGPYSLGSNHLYSPEQNFLVSNNPISNSLLSNNNTNFELMGFGNTQVELNLVDINNQETVWIGNNPIFPVVPNNIDTENNFDDSNIIPKSPINSTNPDVKYISLHWNESLTKLIDHIYYKTLAVGEITVSITKETLRNNINWTAENVASAFDLLSIETFKPNYVSLISTGSSGTTIKCVPLNKIKYTVPDRYPEILFQDCVHQFKYITRFHHLDNLNVIRDYIKKFPCDEGVFIVGNDHLLKWEGYKWMSIKNNDIIYIRTRQGFRPFDPLYTNHKAPIFLKDRKGVLIRTGLKTELPRLGRGTQTFGQTLGSFDDMIVFFKKDRIVTSKYMVQGDFLEGEKILKTAFSSKNISSQKISRF